MDAVFVTGATGYVGRAFVAAARAAAVPVVALARTPPAAPADGVTWVAGDVTADGPWTRALAGCRAVVHLAAVTGKAAPDAYRRVHVEGTRRVLDAARAAGVARVVHVSTVAVAFRERPHYPYAATKAEAEELVRGAAPGAVIVRPTMVVGRDAPVLTGLAKLACAPVVPVFGDGRARVQPVAVADLAADLLLLARGEGAAGSCVDSGGADVVTIEELLRRIRTAAGRGAARVLHLPARPVRGLLGLVEPLLRPLLPLTAGQIATFLNDGVARPGPLDALRTAPRRALDDVLREACARG